MKNGMLQYHVLSNLRIIELYFSEPSSVTYELYGSSRLCVLSLLRERHDSTPFLLDLSISTRTTYHQELPVLY